MRARKTYTVLITLNEPKSYHSIKDADGLANAIDEHLDSLCEEGECPRPWSVNVFTGDLTKADHPVVPSGTMDELKAWSTEADVLAKAKLIHKALREVPDKG